MKHTTKPRMDELFASMKEQCEATYYDYEVQLSKVTAQRDELLAALKEIQSETRESRDFRSVAMCAAIAHKAISKAEAKE